MPSDDTGGGRSEDRAFIGDCDLMNPTAQWTEIEVDPFEPALRQVRKVTVNRAQPETFFRVRQNATRRRNLRRRDLLYDTEIAHSKEPRRIRKRENPDIAARILRDSECSSDGCSVRGRHQSQSSAIEHCQIEIRTHPQAALAGLEH